MKYLISYLLLILIFSCDSSKNIIKKQNNNVSSTCGDSISVKYNKETRNDYNEGMIVRDNKESVIIYFEDFFNGYVKAYSDNKLLFNEKIETEESLGTTGKYFTYNYSKDKSIPVLNIFFEENCVEFSINKKFNLIYIYYYNDNWDIIYSNVYPTYE